MVGGEHVRGRQLEVGLAAQHVSRHRADVVAFEVVQQSGTGPDGLSGFADHCAGEQRGAEVGFQPLEPHGAQGVRPSGLCRLDLPFDKAALHISRWSGRGRGGGVRPDSSADATFTAASRFAGPEAEHSEIVTMDIAGEELAAREEEPGLNPERLAAQNDHIHVQDRHTNDGQETDSWTTPPRGRKCSRGEPRDRPRALPRASTPEVSSSLAGQRR